MLVTESQSGDAPKPQFSMKTNQNYEKSGNQDQINHRNWSLLLPYCMKSMLSIVQGLLLYWSRLWCSLQPRGLVWKQVNRRDGRTSG